MDDQVLDNPHNQRFTFAHPAQTVSPDPVAPVEKLAPVADQAALERIRKAVEAVGEATYHWNIESDEILWSPNASAVLGCQPEQFSSGRSFATLLDTDNFTSRFDTVMRTQNRDTGDGVSFQIEYLFRPEGRQGKSSVWLEDHGKWFGGQDGSPIEVFGTVRRIDDRHNRDQHLSFLGNCDPLTGMMNRGRMTEALGESISVAIREQGVCAFVIAAVNNLSVVNEAYGFEVADEVIVAMGRRLRQVVRAGDGIARYSGSKFGIILNACNEEELQIAVERFLAVARESVIETQHGPVWAMLSVGALCLPTNATDANTAMARAEEALTEARKQPSDGFMIYRPSEKRAAVRALNARCATEIVQCLKADRFKQAFQPIISAKTGDIVMHEALLRMTDENEELIAAAHLIPIAEKLGLVRLIDRAVVQMTMAALHTYPDARLAINVSGTTATDPRWYNQITDIIADNPTVSDRLTVEITETVALHDIQSTKRFVERLRNTGCNVAIDDFGAGFTSFRNIRELPINILKLDGSFCVNLRENPENQYFVKASIEMAHRFDLKTVAEWVETHEDADTLRSWNIDYLQGNLFGEAQVITPWEKAEGLTFELTERPTPIPEIWTATIAEPAEPGPAMDLQDDQSLAGDLADAEKPAEDSTTITLDYQEAEQPVDLPAPEQFVLDYASGHGTSGNWPEPVTESPVDPTESVEGDLSRLRAAIDLLNQFFPAGNQPKPAPSEDEAERLAS